MRRNIDLFLRNTFLTFCMPDFSEILSNTFFSFLRLKLFIERWTGKKIPSRTSLTRNYMEAVFNATYGNIIEKFKNCKFALTIDEARDVCGKSVAGVLFNKLDNNEKPALIEVIELDATNHRTIIQLVTFRQILGFCHLR